MDDNQKKYLIISSTESSIDIGLLDLKTYHFPLYLKTAAMLITPFKNHPPTRTTANSMLATIEHAVKVQSTTNIIFIGCYLSDFIQVLKGKELNQDLPYFKSFVENDLALDPELASSAKTLDEKNLTVFNIKHQIKNLKSHEFIQSLIDRNQLVIDGYVYDSIEKTLYNIHN
ncbi:hypothetical protein OAB57_01865 [Bacteriovoracaceae bacterium]|nr:hypothetical protein [Bacteriovoracaceae bacterium]